MACLRFFDVDAELLFAFCQVKPQLAPCRELLVRRPEEAHLLGAVPLRQRVLVYVLFPTHLEFEAFRGDPILSLFRRSLVRSQDLHFHFASSMALCFVTCAATATHPAKLKRENTISTTMFSGVRLNVEVQGLNFIMTLLVV